MLAKIKGREKEELLRVAMTSMQTKMVSREAEELAKLVVSAALMSAAAFIVDRHVPPARRLLRGT